MEKWIDKEPIEKNVSELASDIKNRYGQEVLDSINNGTDIDDTQEIELRIIMKAKEQLGLKEE